MWIATSTGLHYFAPFQAAPQQVVPLQAVPLQLHHNRPHHDRMQYKRRHNNRWHNSKLHDNRLAVCGYVWPDVTVPILFTGTGVRRGEAEGATGPPVRPSVPRLSQCCGSGSVRIRIICPDPDPYRSLRIRIRVENLSKTLPVFILELQRPTFFITLLVYF